MALSVSNVVISTFTFNDWINKTNELAYDVSTYALTANTTAGVTTGNAYLNGIFSSNTLAVYTDLRGGNVGTSATLSMSGGFKSNSSIYAAGSFTANASTNQIVESVSLTSYRTSKYVVQVTSATGYQCTELLAMHDGTNVYLTEYATLNSNGSQGTLTANVSSGNLNLLYSPNATASSNVYFQRTSLAV